MESIVIGIIVGSYIVSKKIKSVIKYNTRKRLLKKRLIKSFKERNKNLIKKSIFELKEFDEKKLKKYLFNIVVDDDKLNEENVMSLAEDFSMIDNIEENRILVQSRLENHLDDKLDLMERRRQEIIMRKNQMRAKSNLKAKKFNRVSGKMG